MNRAQRRAAESQRAKRPAFFLPCDRDNLARAISTVSQAGLPGMVELLRAVRAGTISLLYLTSRTAIVTPADLACPTLPTVALIGDDDAAPTGPAGWASAPTICAWVQSAVIHAAGATAETYRQAVDGARIEGSCALVETTTAHAQAWAELLAGRPRALIWPTNGVHPVNPPRSAMQ